MSPFFANEDVVLKRFLVFVLVGVLAFLKLSVVNGSFCVIAPEQ